MLSVKDIQRGFTTITHNLKPATGFNVYIRCMTSTYKSNSQKGILCGNESVPLFLHLQNFKMFLFNVIVVWSLTMHEFVFLPLLCYVKQLTQSIFGIENVVNIWGSLHKFRHSVLWRVNTNFVCLWKTSRVPSNTENVNTDLKQQTGCVSVFNI